MLEIKRPPVLKLALGGVILSELIVAEFTLTALEALCPLKLALILTTPSLIGDITPLESTVAIDSSAEDQVAKGE